MAWTLLTNTGYCNDIKIQLTGRSMLYNTSRCSRQLLQKTPEDFTDGSYSFLIPGPCTLQSAGTSSVCGCGPCTASILSAAAERRRCKTHIYRPHSFSKYSRMQQSSNYSRCLRGLLLLYRICLSACLQSCLQLQPPVLSQKVIGRCNQCDHYQLDFITGACRCVCGHADGCHGDEKSPPIPARQVVRGNR